MYNSKVIQVIRSFSQDELRRFSDFLNSPFFNKSKNAIKLFEFLRKAYPDFEEKKIEKEKIYNKIFGNKSYNEQVMKNLSSELLKLANEFVGMEFYTDEKNYSKQIDIISGLNARKIDSIYKKEWKSLWSDISNNNNIELNILFDYKYRLMSEERVFLLSRDRSESGFLEVTSLKGYSVANFLINCFQLAMDYHINKNLYNHTSENNPATFLLEHLIADGSIYTLVDKTSASNPECEIPLKIFLYRHLAYVNPYDNLYYDKLKELVLNNLDDFGRMHQHQLTTSLINIAVRKNNIGVEAFEDETFELMKLQLERRIHKVDEGEYMTVFKFRNIFLTALKLKKYDWLEEFMVKYSDELSPEYKESVVNNHYAFLEFYKGNFEKALDYISKVKYDKFVFKLDVKNLTLSIYYELGYFEEAISLIDTYRHFLLNNKTVNEDFRVRYLEFINFVGALIKLRTGGGDTEKFRERIEETPKLTNRDWFFRKLEEIKVTVPQ